MVLTAAGVITRPGISTAEGLLILLLNDILSTAISNVEIISPLDAGTSFFHCAMDTANWFDH